MDEVYRNWRLPLGFTAHQYWPAEIIIKRGEWKRYIKAPWFMTFVSSQWRMADGSWMERPKLDVERLDDTSFIHSHPATWVKEYPYTYTTRQGVEQRAVCTVWHERSKRRPHWLRWFPVGKWEEGITFRFSEEMGTQAGSWKGGVVGASQSMFPGETVDQCVARMMRERDWR